MLTTRRAVTQVVSDSVEQIEMRDVYLARPSAGLVLGFADAWRVLRPVPQWNEAVPPVRAMRPT